MRKVISSPTSIAGSVTPPGDKSISQRALLLNSIAEGPAHVSNLCVGDDRNAILRCMRGLGAKIVHLRGCDVHPGQDCYEVRGRGRNGLTEPSGVINAGNSGTAMRLIAGLLAAQPFLSVITGDRSLRSRPMDRIVHPLSQMGATIMGRGDDSLAPLAVRGGDLKGIEYSVPVASAQVKSAIMIAGIHADGRTLINVPAQSRDHTERLMTAMGADIRVDGLQVSVSKSDLSPVDVEVPGDVSTAAFWLVAGCCHPNARVRVNRVGINPTRAGVLKVLEAMGANVRIENVREEGGEPEADLIAETSSLTATEIRGEQIAAVVDELPVLAVAAAVARGTTVIADAEELRYKESDRIKATVDGLSRLGANIEERRDGMVIRGGGALKGAACESYGDHRIAMSMAIAGLIAAGRTQIEGAEAAAVSYPEFWTTLQDLSGDTATD